MPTNNRIRRRHFLLEKSRIERYFSCFSCEILRDRLECRATISPGKGCDSYKISLKYREGGVPKVFVMKPKIKPNSSIHIYKEGYLCLYDHRSSPWSDLMKIHETIIPWAAEWLVYYELWKTTGEWLGPEAQHHGSKKKPERR